jgi:hypothetical protein
MTRGWHDAAATIEFDEFESAEWQEGHRLWHCRASAKRAADSHPVRTYRLQ